MKLKAIIEQLERLAPTSLQESYDNSGLLVGNYEDEIESAIVCLDSTEDVVDEAIANNCQLIIAHHPLIFSGLKRLNGKNYIERAIIKAIKNDIAIYAIHTNLDNVSKGVNSKIADKLGLVNLKILSPKTNHLLKLVFYCPLDQTETVREKVFLAGAGQIGEYDYCSFNIEGEGTFRAGDETDPFVGNKGEFHKEKEVRVEVVLPIYLKRKVLKALLLAHPYEEVAYDFYELANQWNTVGSGMIGELQETISVDEFLGKVKHEMNTACIRYTKLIKDEIKKVAVCGGSGSFLLNAAIAQGADVFITSDFKYHQFFDADNKIIIADIGHYESEQYTPHLIQEYLQEKLPNFATYLSKINTNPINYR